MQLHTQKRKEKWKFFGAELRIGIWKEKEK